MKYIRYLLIPISSSYSNFYSESLYTSRLSGCVVISYPIVISAGFSGEYGAFFND